jgi:eukaryotic-like serine/threonine-protein kinase
MKPDHQYIAVTETRSQRIFRDRRRLQLSDCGAQSGFGSSITYLVGTAATQIKAREQAIPIDEASHTPAICRSAPVSTLKAGMQFGPFRLLQRLGQGAQGDVWKARRLDPLVETVALKVLNPALASHPNRLAQFRREAERGARLDGPSLLQVFEFGDIQGFLFMAMPYVEGTTLQQVIRGRRHYLDGDDSGAVHRMVTMDEDSYLHTAVRIMAKAARALGRLHSGKVVHRDIKPANILLDCQRANGVYLCDLGLGRDLEFATPEQMRDGAGTPMYMAPERLLKAPANEILCDIYALGVTLFETLTLQRPFQVPDDMPWGCLAAHLACSKPKIIRDIMPNLPVELERSVQLAMSRNPAARHASADELADELDQFLVRSSFRLRRIHEERAENNVKGPHLPALQPRGHTLRVVS